MTFLNPLVLVGLIAASIPIIIHLLNLRRLKVVQFSSIQFLKEMQKNKMRKVKIKQILLLIIRTLAIIFLVLSFSRPTIRNVKLAGFGSEVKNTIVILIDDSPSMSVADKKGEYFLQAKKLAEKILESVEEGDEIYFFRFSELSPLKNNFEQSSKSLAEREIKNLEISDISKNFIDVFISLSKILEQSKNYSKEIYILTDFQKSNLPDNSYRDLKLDRIIDSNTRIYFFNIGERDAYNISIDSLEVSNRIFEINKQINIAASITNHSEERGTNINSSLYFNDKKVAQKGIDLNSKSSGIFSFNGQIKEYGFNSSKLELEDDDFLRDNVRYFNFYVPEKFKVLMVAENPADLMFVNIVLSQSLDDNLEPIFSITQTSPQFFNSYKPEDFEVLIISSPEKLFNLKPLQNYIEKGGMAILIPGTNSSSILFGRTLEELGLNNIVGFSGSKENQNVFTRFKEIDFNHPIFTGIFTERSTRKIESPKVFYSFNYKSTLNGKDIILLENNYAFLCEEKIGEGSVLIFTSAFDLKWSEFPLKPIFVPLINRIAFYSSSSNINYSAIAGEEVNIKLKKLFNDIHLIHPDGNEVVISKNENPTGLINLGKLDKIGNYKLVSNNRTIGVVSVNIDTRESNLTKLDESKLRDFANNSFPRGSIKVLSADVDPVQVIKQERYGTELWKLFLFIVIILLIIEMIIARSNKKDLITIEQINK